MRSKPVPKPVFELGSYPCEVEAMNEIWGEISDYGTKQMPDGRVWVIHGLTGKPIERKDAVPMLSDGKRNVIYLQQGEKFSPGDRLYPSVWKNPTKFKL